MAQPGFQSFKESEENWVIREKSWDPCSINLWESKFALANGLLGCRGIYEELPDGSDPGTYLGGFFDHTGSLVAELVNLPNPLQLWFSLKGEKLGISRMDFLSHHRELDLKNGLLFRYTLYRDTEGRRYEYRSLRLLSMADRRLGLMLVELKSLDEAANLMVEAGIDTSVYNAANVTEGKKRHWRIREIRHQDNMEYYRIAGLDEGVSLAIGSYLLTSKGNKKLTQKDTHFNISLRKQETFFLTKLFVIHGPEKQDPKRLFREVHSHLKAGIKKGTSALIREHKRAWQGLWKRSDVVVQNDLEVQQALRFNLFHLLTTGPAPDSRLSIGAKALSGEGYRNHIFWDADIFLMPFYTHTHPAMARQMLLYRFDRLGPAREIAKEKGYQGAMYPWESAGDGYEETPPWAKGLDGSVTRIHTHLQEHHITADIAYAVARYEQATGDGSFMLAVGVEMLLETARFWASRMEYHRRKKCYEIKKVIGPDEFHEAVDNNAYTNYLARHNLLMAHHWAQEMVRQFPEVYKKLCLKLGLKDEEIQAWKGMAAQIKINVRKDGVVEQFDGYFKRKKIPLKQFDEYGLPKLPDDFNWHEIGQTQLLKQADVLLLFQLFPERFKVKTKKINFEFYEPRTVHQSSLSVGTRSLVASQLDLSKLAYEFFLAALYLDLKNLKGNTEHGLHSANLGNVWQAVVFGFGGIHFDGEILHIQPRLPTHWKKLSFSFLWRGIEMDLTLFHKKVEIYLKTKKKSLTERFKIFGRFRKIPLNKNKVIRR